MSSCLAPNFVFSPLFHLASLGHSRTSKYNTYNVDIMTQLGLLRWLSDKESACNTGDVGLSLGWEVPLEEEMATHSSILAWRIPWREEPGGLQSMGSQRVRHDVATEQQ